MRNIIATFEPHDLPRGIWYEEDRQRYRVRIYNGTQVWHRSYHRNFDDALIARNAAIRERDARPLLPRELDTTSNQLAALFGDAHEASGDNPRMNQLLTVDRFIQLYYEEGSRPSKNTVYRLIRLGRLAARRVGRAYYITTEEAERFVAQQGN